MSLTPFTVDCPTCTSRLRVQDPGLIGTIASCPRCGSMVQILPPDDSDDAQRLVAGSSVDSQAITAESDVDPDAAARPIAPGGFSSSDAAPPVADTLPSSPEPTWQSDQTAKRRRIATIVAVGSCSLLAAVAMFAWFVRSYRQSRSGPVAQNVDSLDNASINHDIASPTLNPIEPEPDVNEPSPTVNEPDTEPEPVDATPAIPVSEAAPGSNVMAKGTDSVTQPNASVSETTTDPKPTPEVPLANSLESLARPWQVAEADDPAIAAAIRRQEDAAADNTGKDERGSMTELPPGLAEFTSLLDLAGSNLELPPTMEAPPTIAEVDIKAAAQDNLDPMMVANPPADVNLDAALAIRMAIDSPGYPLPDMALVIGQITGVQIHIDWLSFDLNGVDLAAPIATPKGWKNASEILDEMLTGLGGEIRREDSMLILTLRDDVFNGTYQKLIDASDFGAESPSAINLLSDYLSLDADPPSQASLAAIADRENQQLASLAMDTLRRMRDIKPRIDDKRYGRWCAQTSAPRQPDAQPIGQWLPLTGIQPIAQLDAPDAFSGVLRQLAQSNQSTCFINGYDARRRRLSPDQLMMPFSEPAGEKMLQQMLSPFKLQVRRVDSANWWLGTEATYDRLPVLVYTAPLGAERNVALQRMGQLAESEAGNDLRYILDPVSDRLLILCPRYIARQLSEILSP